MSVSLSKKNQALGKQINIHPQAILQIEGIGTVFGVQPVIEFNRFDNGTTTWDDGSAWDSGIVKPGSMSVIDLKNGTTKNITQQILPDKGGSSSISTVNIQMVDLDNAVARTFSFDNITEILGKKADFYIGYKEGTFPEDSIPVFRGIIVDFYTTDGVVMVTVSSPENLKRQTILEKYISNLNGAIDSTQTSIIVNDTSGLLPAQDIIQPLIRIGDEAMRVTSIVSGTQLLVDRGVDSTVATTHDDDSEVESIYKVVGKPVDIALKMMLSDDENSFFNSDDLPLSVNFISITESLGNSLIFEYFDIKELTGLVAGDSIRLTGINAGDYTIKSFGKLSNGSYITTNETLIDEIEFAGTFEYKSQYNVLADGLGMLPNNVDVESHVNIANQFPTNFVDYTFYVDDTIDDTKEFIEKELYFPQGLYSIIRKARSSVKIVTPPFSSDIVPTINLSNVVDIEKVKQRRSLHKYLYNNIRFDYNKDIFEDKFLTKDLLISTTSLNRIKGGRKQLKIESNGLRRSNSTSLALNQTSQRMIDRYKFAPTYFEKLQVKYSDGFSLEIGDILPFGGLETKIVNLQTGKRGVEEQLFEVINKTLNIASGTIELSLLSTSFDINSRNAVVNLSSGCGSNSTTTNLELVVIANTEEYLQESDKWADFIGQNIRVFKNDYTEDETVVLKSIDPANSNFLIVEPALSFIPGVDHIIDIPIYNDSNSDIDSSYKLRFAYLTAQVEITSVTSTTVFNVDRPGDLVVGSNIYIHSDNFTRDSFGGEQLILSIVGSTVTLDTALSFLPIAGDKVENSYYNDNGFPYAII